jgi:WD40 repeat protein
MGRRPARTQVGFQKDSKWMYSGSEDGTVRIWDLRAPGCQREYQSRAAVNTVALHPNQGELISGARGPAGAAVCVPAGAGGPRRARGHAGAAL